jgi:ribosomal protein L37AE/L43A
MDYYAADRKWQCYSCGFENFKAEVRDKTHPHPVLPLEREGVADKDKSNALVAIPAAESLFDLSSAAKSSPGYWEPKKESVPSKKLPATAKDCPACGKKMHRYGSDKGWQCSSCGYERKI